MRGSGDSMALRGADAPAPEVEERSDEAPGAGGALAGRAPDPEVVAKPKRRQFSAEYRLRIFEEADRCTRPGEIGRLLRREGLYSSHLSVWRKARRNGSLTALTPSTFALWRRRLRGPAVGSESNGAARFVELADSPPASASWEAELDLGDGVVLRLRRPSRC